VTRSVDQLAQLLCRQNESTLQTILHVAWKDPTLSCYKWDNAGKSHPPCLAHTSCSRSPCLSSSFRSSGPLDANKQDVATTTRDQVRYLIALTHSSVSLAARRESRNSKSVQMWKTSRPRLDVAFSKCDSLNGAYAGTCHFLYRRLQPCCSASVHKWWDGCRRRRYANGIAFVSSFWKAPASKKALGNDKTHWLSHKFGKFLSCE